MIIKEDKEDYGRKSISLVVQDSEGQIEDLLDYISNTASAGHSFRITVDPDNEDYTKDFYVDGDGFDRLDIESVAPIEDSEEDK